MNVLRISRELDKLINQYMAGQISKEVVEIKRQELHAAMNKGGKK